MRTLEHTTKAILMSIATDSDMQPLSRELNTIIDGAQSSVGEVTNNVGVFDRAMAGRLDDVQACRTDMKQGVQNMTAEAVEEARRGRSWSRDIHRRSPRRTIAAGSSTQGESRLRVCHIHGFAAFSGSDGSKRSKEECRAEQHRIKTIMGEEFEPSTIWLQPFATNHAISTKSWQQKRRQRRSGRRGRQHSASRNWATRSTTQCD